MAIETATSNILSDFITILDIAWHGYCHHFDLYIGSSKFEKYRPKYVESGSILKSKMATKVTSTSNFLCDLIAILAS